MKRFYENVASMDDAEAMWLSNDINDVRPFLDGVNRLGMQPGSNHGSILGSHRIPSNNPERKPNNE